MLSSLLDTSRCISKAIADYIEKLILDGDLLPSQKIPSERQLCNKLKVSRAAVREALRVLQGRGLIATLHGKGSFVAEIIQPLQTNSPFIQWYYDHSRTLYDFNEVRTQLEGQAASLAAQRATTKDLYLLEKAFKALENATPKTFADCDQTFHKTIAQASHNPFLMHLLASLEELLSHSVQASITNLYPIDALKIKMDRQHLLIHQAIRNKSAKKALKAATEHVQFVSDHLQALENQGEIIIRQALK